MWLNLCCPHSGILTYLVPAWNGIVQMDSRDNVTLCWLSALVIIHNKWWLLKFHMAHAQYVKFLWVHSWGIQLFANSITQEISMFTWSFWMRLILMLCTLLKSNQSATTSGNTLSGMAIGFGSLMNSISRSWVQLKTYCTGCSNTWKEEMSRINLTINSHWCHNIEASSASLNHSIVWKAAPCREQRFRAQSEHWQ